MVWGQIKLWKAGYYNKIQVNQTSAYNAGVEVGKAQGAIESDAIILSSSGTTVLKTLPAGKYKISICGDPGNSYSAPSTFIDRNYLINNSTNKKVWVPPYMDETKGRDIMYVWDVSSQSYKGYSSRNYPYPDIYGTANYASYNRMIKSKYCTNSNDESWFERSHTSWWEIVTLPAGTYTLYESSENCVLWLDYLGT